MSPTVTRTCLLLAKIIQNTANLAFFGEKERYMIELNNVITDNLDKMKKFLDELCEEVNIITRFSKDMILNYIYRVVNLEYLKNITKQFKKIFG